MLLIKKIFSRIHPNIDFNSKDFLSDFSSVLKQKGTKIDESNFTYILNLCDEFFDEYDTELFNCDIKAILQENYKILLDNIYLAILLTVKDLIIYGSLKIYDDFKNAYNQIIKNKKYSYFLHEKIWIDYNKLINLIYVYINEFNNIFSEKKFSYAFIQILSVLEKTVHNLKIMSKEEKIKEVYYWEEKEVNLHADTHLCITINYFYSGDTFDNERFINIYNESISDMRLFAFCINKGNDILDKYFDYNKGKELKHWYNLYKEISSLKYSKVPDDMNTIGKYLCENIEQIQCKRILYHSNFYECLALEYAYKHNNPEVARKIICNGYDYYLELGTLYIIYNYDRELFLSFIYDLKLICLQRRINESKENYYNTNRYIRNIYGDKFCDDFVTHAKKAILNLKFVDENDPRLKEKRNTPDWAK